VNLNKLRKKKLDGLKVRNKKGEAFFQGQLFKEGIGSGGLHTGSGTSDVWLTLAISC
jgi:hypothetical protein